MSQNPLSLIERHETVKKRRRVLRVVGPVTLVVLIAVNIVSLAGWADDFDQERFSAALQEEGTRAWPRLKERFSAIRDDVGPDLEMAFVREMDRLNAEVGELFAKEEEVFRARSEAAFIEIMEATASAEKVSRQAVVVRHIPELAGNEKGIANVVSHVEAAAHQWVLRQWTRRFEGHLLALGEIQKTLNRSYRLNSDVVSAHEAPEDFVLLWLELFNETVAGHNN